MKRFVSLVLILALVFQHLAVYAQVAPLLQIRRQGADLILAWPADTAGFRLETTDALGTDWTAVSFLPQTIDGEFRTEVKATRSSQFFRLFRPGDNPPSLANVAVDKNFIFPSETANLRLAFDDPDADITVLVVRRSNWMGIVTDRIPAATLGLDGKRGEINDVLRTDLLAFGLNSLCVWLEDSAGRKSAETCFEVTLGGAGAGTAPQLTALTPQSVEQRLPEGLNKVSREFALTWNDPDGDVARVRVQITLPDGGKLASELEAASFGIAGASGVATLPLLRLKSTDEPGNNAVEVTLVDASGNVGNTLSAVILTSRDFGEELLRVDEAVVEHNGAAADRVLLVRGQGFETADMDQNRVQLSGLTLKVFEATETTLRAALPSDAMPGPVRVANRHGSAWAPGVLTGLPLELRITPEDPAVAPGGAQILKAFVNNQPALKIEWSVNGIPGGNAEVGLISPEGEYIAPSKPTVDGSVRITAIWEFNRSISAGVTVRLTPPPPAVNSGPVTAKEGGIIVTSDGRGSIEAPPNALLEDAIVSLKLLEGPDLPAAPPGQQVLAAFEFEAQPLAALKPAKGTKARAIALGGPVATTVPLMVGQAPGQGTIENVQVIVEGEPVAQANPVVSGDGSSVTMQIAAPGRVLVIGSIPPSTPSPVLREMVAGCPLEEGRSVPVRLVGENLAGGLRAEILNDRGAPTRDVFPGTLFTLGTEAGITLHIGTIRDLGNSQRRSYTLVLRNSEGASASLSFDVLGLDEFPPRGFLEPGGQMDWSMDVTTRYSTINIPQGATLSVLEPVSIGGQIINGIRQGGVTVGGVLKWECTGPVHIDGAIDGHGRNGARANGAGGGGAGLIAGHGGAGRTVGNHPLAPLFPALPEGYLLISPVDRTYLAPLEDSIGDSADDRTDIARIGVWNFGDRYGFGGLPGKNSSLLDDILKVLELVGRIFQLAANLFSCITAGGTSCAYLVVSVAETVDVVSGLVEHFQEQGGRGSPGRPGEPARISGQLRGHSGGGGGGGGHYNFIVGTHPGAGGGGGGEGGRGISIISAGHVFLNGSLDTRGGDGGEASEDGERRRPRDPNTEPAHGRLSGGGGGAGSGGDIVLRTLGEIWRGPQSSVNTQAGKPGVGGGLFPDSRNPGQQVLVAHPETRFAEPGVEDFRSAPQPASLGLVLTRRLYTVSRIGYREPAVLIIKGENNATRRVTVRAGGSAKLVLFDGFNRIYDERDEHGSDLLQRCMLVLANGVAAGPDSDGDGLGSNDEIELGTDPNLADTDGDGVNDYVELKTCRNPLFAEPPALATDSDCDGWPDEFERALTGGHPNDPMVTPRLTWLATPKRLELARMENPSLNPGRYPPGARPTTVSAPKPLEVALPVLAQPGTVIPNTTVALPPKLGVQRPQ